MYVSSRALNSASDCWAVSPSTQRPRKARYHAVLPAQAPIGFLPRIPARQRHHPHDLGMSDARGIEVVLLRQRELKHHQLLPGQGVEPREEGCFEHLFGLGLVRAVNVHFRLDDWYEASSADLLSYFELLAHNVLDAGGIGLLDDRAHLGTEDALRFGFVEQRRQGGHGPHQLDPVLLSG